MRSQLAEEQPVGRLEAGRTQLAFEDGELVAEGQNLDLECGFGLPAEDKKVQQRADDGVEEAQDHGEGSWRLGRGGCRRAAGVEAIIRDRITGDDPLS